jgi:hypothetical protein
MTTTKPTASTASKFKWDDSLDIILIKELLSHNALIAGHHEKSAVWKHVIDNVVHVSRKTDLMKENDYEKAKKRCHDRINLLLTKRTARDDRSKFGLDDQQYSDTKESLLDELNDATKQYEEDSKHKRNKRRALSSDPSTDNTSQSIGSSMDDETSDSIDLTPGTSAAVETMTIL